MSDSRCNGQQQIDFIQKERMNYSILHISYHRSCSKARHIRIRTEAINKPKCDVEQIKRNLEQISNSTVI